MQHEKLLFLNYPLEFRHYKLVQRENLQIQRYCNDSHKDKLFLL